MNASRVTPKPDPALAKDYPRAIREAYVGAVRKGHPSDRHQQLLRLGEAALGYLASLAFADYRQARRLDPDPAVEHWVSGLSRVTTGEYLQAFRMTQKALGRPEIFGIRRYEVNAKLSEAARLAAAIRALDYAQRVGATNIRAAIQEASSAAQKSVRWLGFWNDFVDYRNRVIHADDKGWPIDAEGYFDLMAPLLEAALVEALTTEYIAHVLLEYPVARLEDVRRVGSDWVLAFDGEYRGAPLIADIRHHQPPEAWQTDTGASYVLRQQAQDDWVVYARYFDLKRDGFPVAVVSSSVEAPTPERSTDAPPEPEKPLANLATPKPSPTSLQSEPRASSAEERHAFPPMAAHRGDSAADVSERSRPALPRVAAGQQPTEDTEHWFPSFSPWMLWGICSCGMLAAVGFLRIATKTRDVKLRNWGLGYGALAAAVFVMAAIIGDSDSYPVLDAIAITLLIGTWAGSTVHAFIVNPSIRRKQARASIGG